MHNFKIFVSNRFDHSHRLFQLYMDAVWYVDVISIAVSFDAFFWILVLKMLRLLSEKCNSMSSNERFSVSGNINVIITNLKQKRYIKKWNSSKYRDLNEPANRNHTIKTGDARQTERSLKIIVCFGGNERKQLI